MAKIVQPTRKIIGNGSILSEVFKIVSNVVMLFNKTSITFLLVTNRRTAKLR